METVMHAPAGWRPRLDRWLESAPIHNGLIALILLNAVILGLETSPALMAAWGSWLSAADRAILAVFLGEIVLRLLPASGPLAVLRALRILRVLRLITLVPSMKRVVGGLLAALPGLGSVMGIICIIFYVAAVIATKLFAADFPALFGDLGSSAFTLFQVMTLEGWAMEVVRPVMAVYPASWIFFLIFILASTFTLLNLFIAVIVNAIHQEGAGDRPDPTAAEIARLREEVAALRNHLGGVRKPSPYVTRRR